MLSKIMRILLRILLSPFIAIWGLMLLIAFTFFPILIGIVWASFIGLISEPFIYLLKLGGTKINPILPFSSGEYRILSYLLGLTVYVWAIPAIVINYLTMGEVWTGGI